VVTFTGGATAAPTNVTPLSLKVVVPAGALTGPVSVTNPAGTGSTTARFTVRPKISGFTPAGAIVGGQVIVTGTSLTVGADIPVVKVGAIAAPVVASSPTEVTFTVPVGARTARISVTTADGTASSATPLVVTP
jgi:hypothetical protein